MNISALLSYIEINSIIDLIDFWVYIFISVTLKISKLYGTGDFKDLNADGDHYPFHGIYLIYLKIHFENTLECLSIRYRHHEDVFTILKAALNIALHYPRIRCHWAHVDISKRFSVHPVLK